ncbi:Arrestin domain-containing protein 1 [Orchesella cincta]|uniref:Arrestin domain-containing protein 1 n=1 Tax=Orchesella cincta TaxID=48709 RepID=A0A1D2N5C3_ORCCI|nr:Arrestin domain-containing protein 1 [Orchesella cincta]
MALKIELVGKGVVNWEKEHYFVENSNNRGRPRIPDEETYIYQEKYLIGERAESPVTLPPGVHSFPYFFTLSPWLPSSFEGRHCHIRYSLQATLVRALFKDLKSEPLKFLIKGILDLNQYPTIARPINVNEQKNWDFLCWKLWSVVFNLSIDKTGFVPGEILKFLAKFNNSCSNVKLTPVKAYLIQKVTVKAPRAKSSYEHKVLKVKGPIIEGGEIENWEGSFEVPHVEPSGLGLYPSQVLRFNVQYCLKVVAKNVFNTISRKVGLTIGTIAIRDSAAAPAPISSEIVTFCGGQQFTPYKNLSDTFPPILANNRSGSSNNISARNATTSQTHTNTNLEETANNINNSMPIASSPLSELPPSEISSPLTILPETTKGLLNRTDTPPPTYEEAIKKPPPKKS